MQGISNNHYLQYVKYIDPFSISSAAAQLFLTDIFSSFFTVHLQVRLTSLTVLNLILKQGLVHPAQVRILHCC